MALGDFAEIFFEERRGRLRLAYQVLSDQKKYADDLVKRDLSFIDTGPFSHFASTIEGLQKEFPEVLPQFAKENLRHSTHAYYARF